MGEDKQVGENKPTDYISFEQKSGLNDFGNYFGKSLYGTVISMYRLPTLVRKLRNRQTFIQRENLMARGPLDSFKNCGTVLGFSAGLVANSHLLTYSISEAGKGNYGPLAILGTTTFVALIFELGRLSRSKQEYLERKTRIGAENSQEGLEAEVRTP